MSNASFRDMTDEELSVHLGCIAAEVRWRRAAARCQRELVGAVVGVEAALEGAPVSILVQSLLELRRLALDVEVRLLSAGVLVGAGVEGAAEAWAGVASGHRLSGN